MQKVPEEHKKQIFQTQQKKLEENQKQLLEDIAFYFENLKRNPDYTIHDSPDHGRSETRNIWVTTELNDYLDFPHVGQAFMVERISHNQKSGKETRIAAYGITSKTPDAHIKTLPDT